MRSFVRRYRQIGAAYDVHDVHFRLNCLLAMLVRLKPLIVGGQLNFSTVNLLQFEADLSYAVRYSMSELCFYFKSLCECYRYDRLT